MRSRVVIIGAVIVVAVAGGGATWWWQREQRAQIIRPAVGAVPGFDLNVESAMRRAGRGDVEALAELSRVYHANGALAAAARCYEVLEQLQPNEPRWPHRHATIAAGFGDTAPAIARWRRVIELAPEYLPARLRLGEVWLKTNRPSEAAAVFNDVLKRKPDDPHAALGLARLDVEAGRWPEARARLEKIVAQTDYALGYDLIVTVYEKLGLAAEAAAVRGRSKASGAYRDFADPWMEELLDDCQDAYQLALAAGAAEGRGDLASAVRWLERAIALAPNDPAARFQLAGLHTRRRDAAKAREQLERCTQIAPTFADGWAHLTALLESGGDPAGAERTVASGLRHCPESPGLHLMRARQLRRAGQGAAALDAYRRSIQLRANEAEPHVEFATLLFQAGRADEAVRALHAALDAEPDHPTALHVLTLAAISTGDEAGARRWLERVRAQPRVAPAQAQQLQAAFRERFGREAR